MKRFFFALAAGALVGCSPSAEDVQSALQKTLETGAANIPDTACGFTTFGLENPKISNFKILSSSQGSATITGTAKNGIEKGKACNGNITFNYAKGRSVTQGANGESVSYTVVVMSAQRTGP